MLGDGAAVSVWIPPGGSELSDEQNDEMTSLATTRLGADGAAALSEVFKRFEDAHPRAEAHYYLSLLGTHPAWRGRGLGIGLLETNLTVIDAEGVPSYLESSNSANDKRYQRLGYEPLRTFDLAAGQRVTGMWRSVGNGR